MGSSRLPGKALKKIGNYNLIDWVIKYAKKNFNSEEIFVATTTSKNDDKLVEYLSSKKITLFRGSEKNVFSRFESISKNFNKNDIIVRFTGDNPIKSNSVIQSMKQKVMKNNIDYCCLRNLSKLAVEFIKIKLLDEIQSKKFFDILDIEHVTWNIRKKLKCSKLIINQEDFDMEPNLDRLITVDTSYDLSFLDEIVKKLDIAPGEDLNIASLYKFIKNVKSN